MTSNNDNERTFEPASGGQPPAAWPPTDWSTGSEWQAEPAPSTWAPPTIPSEWSAPTSTEPRAAWASEPNEPTPPIATSPTTPTSPTVNPPTANAAPPTPVAPPTASSGARRSRGIKSILAAGLLSATLASVGTTALVGGLRGATPAATTPPAPTANAAVTGSRATTEDLTGIVATARQSVVTITADGLSTKGLSPFSVPTTGVGSGIVLTSNGYILTNRHVVEGSSSLPVALMDGTEYPATLVKESTTTDLALIKISASGLVAATI
ncbi:MAG TPA: trypsin-like peptidase domain-containing protein, partial [Methylomirabilota bacterium]|nr:trypsin-like peptidase domain-containing protein [Methylomirabilota bacterium]